MPEALSLLREAVACAPDNPVVVLELADAQFAAGEAGEASASYRRVLDRNPTSIDALCGLGCALAELDQLEDAEGILRMAVALAPDSARAAAGLGVTLLRQGRWTEATEELRRARAGGFSNAGLLNDLGVALRHLNRLDEAREAWRAALALDAGHVQAGMNLGNLYRDEGEIETAHGCYARVLRARGSDCLRIRMATLLPPIYASHEEVHERRRRYGEQLARLAEEKLSPCDPLADGGHNNFYLCYQGGNDRDLQLELAQLYRQVYTPSHREPPKRGPGGRIRVGFVSAFFTDHTIGELNRGIIANLSQELFEVFVFSVGRHEDPTAQSIARNADRHVILPRTLREAEREIAGCGLDVLLYTDIGMEPFTYFLAFSRLAPVQCVTWGHPVTTGIDTIDYFLSSAAQEPPDADAHYSEKLVRLGLLPVYYHPASAPLRKTRADFGLPDAARLYVCPQSLFKLHPDFDAVLRGILAADPRAQIVLPDGHYRQWTDKLRARFARAMPEAAERIRFLPRQGYADYLQLLQRCEVMLDPLHFGGGKTTLDALSLGVPIVTLPGPFMRGRATFACYRQMGIDECVAGDAADYAHKAVRLATEPDYRAAVSRELGTRSVLLAERRDMVRQLEEFLQRAVESG